ncbi:MAG: YceD family protein [Armatimonadota bacterium]
MKLDLTEIAIHPGMQADVEVEEPCPEDLGCTAPARGKLHLANAGSLLIMTGKLETEMKFECGRCLIDFTMPVSMQIEEEFRLEKIGDMMRVLPLEEEEEAADLLSENTLDVHELVRQNILVEMPIQPLCRPECRGLCPTCGENLNVRQCQCAPADLESPFAALADLLDEDEESK